MSEVFYIYLLPVLIAISIFGSGYCLGRLEERKSNDKALEAFIRGAVAQKKMSEPKGGS